MKKEIVSDDAAQGVADDGDGAAIRQEVGVVLHECTVLLVQLELEAVQYLHETRVQGLARTMSEGGDQTCASTLIQGGEICKSLLLRKSELNVQCSN